MPYFKIETNKTVIELERQELLRRASHFLSELLGKPEEYIMVSVHGDSAMLFSGSTAATAYVEVKSIGLARDRCSGYAAAIADFLQAELDVAPERSYIEFTDIDGGLFGWNRGTF